MGFIKRPSRWIFGLFLSAILFGMIGYGVWRYVTPIPVISSKAGNISQGTFSYLRFVYYSDLQKKNSNLEQIVNDCQHSIAIGHLGDRLGLLEDTYYPHFLDLSYQARIQRAAVKFLKQTIGPDFNIQQALKAYDIVSDPKTATTIIQKCIQRDVHRFRLDCPDVVVGQFQQHPLKLSMIKPLLTAKEWQQFLSFLPTPMVDAYNSYLTRFLYHTVHQKLLEKFSPVEKELLQMDHDLVAKRYISVKYGIGHEGIYPTQRLTLDFPQTVLYNHFFAIKNRFLPVETVHVQYTVVKNMDIARMLHQKLVDGADIQHLADQYAINDYFKQTANSHTLMGYGVDGMPSHPEQRAMIDNFLLDAAKKNLYFPLPHPLDKGVLIARLSSLTRKEQSLKYQEYQFAVKHDLSLKTLESKLSLDIEDIIADLSFQFFEDNIVDRLNRL
ncbi:MAG: hypothetical protein HQK75_20155 [Candidatus Magnetomorum sp.]|nr:hypothetical protein [Candidatus Magnetomorum sp.]